MFPLPYKAAAVQMSSGTELRKNLDRAYSLIQQASNQGAAVVGLPENFAFLGGLSMRMKQADRIAEIVPSFLATTAREFGVYLLGGSFPIPTDEGKVHNHSSFYNPEGEKRAEYNKIHLFDVSLGQEEEYRESDYVKSGDLSPVVYKDGRIGNWGLSICYDLRFPEYYRKLAAEEAKILTVPSAFTHTTGQDHWRPLLRARAIENTCYVFAPAQTGLHGSNRKTWGHAMIIDPWGSIIADAGTETGIAYAEINPERLAEVRRAIPSLKHRRL